MYNFPSRTYRHLQAVREYEKRVQKMANIFSRTTHWIGQSPRNRAKGFAQDGSFRNSFEVLPSPTQKSEQIAAYSGLRPEEVPWLALRLEGLVGGTERFFLSRRANGAVRWEFKLYCYKTGVFAVGVLHLYRRGFWMTLANGWALTVLYFFFEIQDAMEFCWRLVVG